MKMGNRNSAIRLGVVFGVLALAAVIYFLRPAADASLSTAAETEMGADHPLPRLLDLGADKCVPCKMMAPILEELKTEFAGQFVVEFVDVWKNPDAAKPFNLNLIPTQIFFSADGTELFRHEGFFGREDILSKWQELGVELASKSE
jgi:thioredoxin